MPTLHVLTHAVCQQSGDKTLLVLRKRRYPGRIVAEMLAVAQAATAAQKKEVNSLVSDMKQCAVVSSFCQMPGNEQLLFYAIIAQKEQFH